MIYWICYSWIWCGPGAGIPVPNLPPLFDFSGGGGVAGVAGVVGLAGVGQGGERERERENPRDATDACNVTLNFQLRNRQFGGQFWWPIWWALLHTGEGRSHVTPRHHLTPLPRRPWRHRRRYHCSALESSPRILEHDSSFPSIIDPSVPLHVFIGDLFKFHPVASIGYRTAVSTRFLISFDSGLALVVITAGRVVRPGVLPSRPARPSWASAQ